MASSFLSRGLIRDLLRNPNPSYSIWRSSSLISVPSDSSSASRISPVDESAGNTSIFIRSSYSVSSSPKSSSVEPAKGKLISPSSYWSQFQTSSGREPSNLFKQYSYPPRRPSAEIPINPNPSLFKSFLGPSQSPLIGKPINLDLTFSRSFSSPPANSEAEKSQNPNQSPNSDSVNPQKSAQNHELRHQEIVGPTVEPDLSALANETRQVLENLRKTIYDLSVSLVLLGVAHLGLGTWIIYAFRPSEEVSIQGLAAFAFPFSVAFLMRRTLKPLSFFQKMEQQGRLQILTLALQVSKLLNLMLLRIRVVSVCCVVGMSVASLVTMWLR